MVDANNNRRGILIDLDIAARVREGDKRLDPVLTYAGTLGFRAVDLLLENTHYPTRAMYRDDLESFFYALFYIQRHYRNGHRLPAQDPLEWMSLGEGTVATLGNNKSQWLFKTHVSDSPLAHDWLGPLQILLRRAHAARRKFWIARYKKKMRLEDRGNDASHVEEGVDIESDSYDDSEDSNDDSVVRVRDRVFLPSDGTPSIEDDDGPLREWGGAEEETLDGHLTYELFMNTIL